MAVKGSQSALLLFVYWRLGLCWWGVRSLYLTNMGKCSDEKSVDVAHSQLDPMLNVAWNTSGDVGLVSMLYEVRVGVLGLLSIV